jgi:hypothetical protein
MTLDKHNIVANENDFNLQVVCHKDKKHRLYYALNKPRNFSIVTWIIPLSFIYIIHHYLTIFFVLYSLHYLFVIQLYHPSLLVECFLCFVFVACASLAIMTYVVSSMSTSKRGMVIFYIKC